MMANMSDILLAKLESVSWLYSIDCQMNGRNSTLLLKYIIEDDFYAVMATDLTLTYFECLEGKGIDDHYRRFNKGEIKRERLLSHLKTILTDVTKADLEVETLLVDCHTSRLTLKVQNQLSVLKFKWSFYLISTNPETLSRHLTIPLLRLVSSLRTGIDILHKEIKSKDKQLDQLDGNNSKTGSHSKNSALSDESLVNKIISNERTAAEDYSSLIDGLLKDSIVSSVLRHLQNSDNNQINDNSDQSSDNNFQSLANTKKREQYSSEEEMAKRREIDSQLNTEEKRHQLTTRSNKKPKL